MSKGVLMKNRIIVVGATSGIGREVAKLFAGEGWSVGAVGRRSEVYEPPTQRTLYGIVTALMIGAATAICLYRRFNG